jgi:predicted amidophosphoribosyltransferase
MDICVFLSPPRSRLLRQRFGGRRGLGADCWMNIRPAQSRCSLCEPALSRHRGSHAICLDMNVDFLLVDRHLCLFDPVVASRAGVPIAPAFMRRFVVSRASDRQGVRLAR